MASSRRTRRRSAPAIRLRRATLADAPAIARAMRASIRGLAKGAYAPRRLAAWSSLPALYHAWAMTAGGERYVVAERGGRVVGYAALRRSEVTAVFVRPRSARRGVGAALLARIEAEARRRGVRRLVVRAARSAVAFYRAAGFRGTRAIAVPLPGGLRLPSLLLAKPLP
jgi:GNAT superfamily N-acetyltransferase